MAEPEMSMNQIIHAAVRRDLVRTASALRGLSDGDSGRARDLQRAWANLMRELKHHHEGEDTHLWPYLRRQGIDPALLDAMEAEHRDLHEALVASSKALEGVAADPTTANAQAAAEVVDSSAKIIAGHLEHEERAVEPLVQELRQAAEFKELEKNFRPKGASAMGDALAWMQDGAGERERRALKQTIPPPVVLIVTKLLGRGYNNKIAPVWKA